MINLLHKKIRHTIKGRIKLNEPLKNHTTIKIGGPAQFWVEPQDLNDLINLYKISKQHNLPIFIVGLGSNLIIKDSGIKGICINLNSIFFTKFGLNDNSLRAGAGVSLSRLTKYARDSGLSGCEFLVGIPGTVGGALTMNTGAWNKSIGDLVRQITVLDSEGNIKTLNKDDMIFSYRKSNLDSHIIIESVFKLENKTKDLIRTKMLKFLKEKKRTQELTLPTAGCIFKNPSDVKETAGRLIEKSGLKAKRVGDAIVSTKHANFIINLGKATCRDVLTLIEIIQEKVKRDHGIWLEPEVKIV